MFQAELAAAGEPPAEVVSYAALIENPEALAAIDDGPAIVRQDSHGQDFAVECGLLRLGYEDARRSGASVIDPEAIAALHAERGRIRCPRQIHCGFLRVLGAIERTCAKRPGWRVLQSPAGIRDLFDKRVTSRRWQALGEPVAPPLDVEHYREIRGKAYVKLACGSSASCLALVHVAGPRASMLTTIEMRGDRWYNSRRLQRYEDAADLERIWTFLRAEGAHVERALPKARIDDARFDLRIVVVAGEPAFVVVRCSRTPLTNLHLGGWRGEWNTVRGQLPASTWEAIVGSCRTIARDVGCFCVGLDVLLDPTLRHHTVIEGNAFGDLLPDLTRDGCSVYGWQIRQLLAA